MKRTFHLFSLAVVLALIVSLMQATSAPAQMAATLTPTPTEVVDWTPTPTEFVFPEYTLTPYTPTPVPTEVAPGSTPTQVADLPPTPTQAVDWTPTQTKIGGTPSTWTVTSLEDSPDAVPGNCPHATNCRLRDAIGAASTGDTIVFNPSLSGQTISLTATLVLTKDVVIDSSGLSGQLSLQLTDHNLQILNSTVTLSNLTLQGGSSDGDGGAIWSNGNLTLINSTVRNSHATGNGGGIYSSGALLVRNSAIYENGADRDGGGIYAETSGDRIQIANSTISTNYAREQGEAIYSQGETILSLLNATIAGPYNGSRSQVVSRGQSEVALANSIVACWYRWMYPPETYADCYDFIQPPSITNSILGVRGEGYGLLELADNGGPTKTMAAVADSPVVDAGDDAVCANDLIDNLDQRGMPRPHGNHCDIGAYEVDYLSISGNAGVGGAVLKYGYRSFTTADSQGNYSAKVLPGWSGTVIPTKLNYSFTPAKMDYTDVSVNRADQNYTAAANASYKGKPVNTWRASITNSGEEADNESYEPSISADGRYVAYWSFAGNLVAGDGATDVIVYDNQTGQTAAVSVDSNGNPLNCNSSGPSISADGRYVAFYSCYGGGGLLWIVYVYDRETGILDSVARGSNPSISADGRYVAYVSTDNSNNQPRIVVEDLLTGIDTQASISSTGGQPDGDSSSPAISANGRYVVFDSLATNLVDHDANGARDIFVYDTQTGVTKRVSMSSKGTEANGSSASPSLSADGRYVAFHSAATNLVDQDTNGTDDVFVHDLQTGETTRVSVSNDGKQGNGASNQARISANGNSVAFRSYATDLVAGDTNQAADLFAYDRQTGKIKRLSVASNGAQANGDSPASYLPDFSISEDGRYVAFPSDATNLVSGDNNGYSDIFVHQMSEAAPVVLSITRANPSPTSARSVDFRVTFSEPVKAVDVKDFVLKRTGWVIGATIRKVTGSGDTYTVTVSTGMGSGTLRLEVPVSATITDLDGNPLGGLPFRRGDVYQLKGYRRQYSPGDRY